MDGPLVSVLIPVYNAEGYLEECLASVIGQTHANLSVVLVNDGSTDRSGQLCDEAARRDQRVVVIHQANRGVAQARNVLLDHAVGDFITFVDSDDWVMPTYIEYLLGLVVSNDCDISSCIAWSGSSPDSVSEALPVVWTSDEALQALAGSRLAQLTVLWAKLYRADVFRGLRFPPGRLHEDTFVSYRLFSRAKRIVISDEPLYFYRQPPGSIMSRGFIATGRLDAATAYCEQTMFFAVSGHRDLSHWALRRAFGFYVSVVVRQSHEQQGEVEAEMARVASLLRSAIRAARPSFLRWVYYEACLGSPWLVTKIAAARGGQER